jgi:hypothetical protein
MGSSGPCLLCGDNSNSKMPLNCADKIQSLKLTNDFMFCCHYNQEGLNNFGTHPTEFQKLQFHFTRS